MLKIQINKNVKNSWTVGEKIMSRVGVNMNEYSNIDIEESLNSNDAGEVTSAWLYLTFNII